MPVGGGSDGSLSCFQHPCRSREQGKERVSHPTGGRDRQEGAVRKRSFQMQSPHYLDGNSCSSVIHGFQLFLLSISAWAAPPILSLPLFYNPSLFSPTLFFFLSFSCCCSCINSPSSPISSFLYSLSTDFPRREGMGLSHQGRQSSGAQEPCSAQPSAPAASPSVSSPSLLFSAFLSAKNAKSFGKPYLRNDHVSGIVFPLCPS